MYLSFDGKVVCPRLCVARWRANVEVDVGIVCLRRVKMWMGSPTLAWYVFLLLFSLQPTEFIRLKVTFKWEVWILTGGTGKLSLRVCAEAAFLGRLFQAMTVFGIDLQIVF